MKLFPRFAVHAIPLAVAFVLTFPVPSPGATITRTVVESSAKTRPTATTARRVPSNANGMSINNAVNFADVSFIGAVVTASAPAYNSKDRKPFPETGATVPFYHRVVVLRVTRVLFGPIVAGDVLTFFYAGTGQNDGPVIDRYDSFVLRANYGSGPADVGTSLLVLAKKTEITVKDAPNAFGYQPVEGWRGSWRVRDDRARSLDPKRTVARKALVDRILLERRLGRDGNRDVDTRDVLATSRTEPPKSAAVVLPPGKGSPKSRTVPIFRVVVAHDSTWRVEYGVSTDELAIRVADRSSPWTTGQTFELEGGTIVAPVDHAAMTCNKLSDGSAVAIGVVDRRVKPTTLQMEGEAWRITEAGVLIVVARVTGDQVTAKVGDGRSLVAACPALPRPA